MEILLSGPDWKLRDFIPYQAFGQAFGENIWEPDYDWGSWPNAIVPGNAQLDLLRNGLIEDPYVDLKSRDAEWVSSRQWVYAKKLAIGDELAGKRLTLRFDGIDYAGTIYLNGERLGFHENLSIPVEFDVTGKVRLGEENSLVVILEPAPDEYAQCAWTSKVKTFKPRMPYGWDFAARLIPIGIWQDVKLIATGETRITDVWARANLSEDLQRGTLSLATTLDSSSPRAAVVEYRVLSGEEVIESNSVKIEAGTGRTEQVFEIANPLLWWPNGSGPQNLYTAQVTVRDALSGQVADERTVTFGFKRVRLLPNIGIPEGLRPWNFEINGVRTFIKGWNWVPIDLLYGGKYTEKLERLIRLAAEANVNMLRVWGGGIIEKESFYELCDRFGIMVWQEFTLSGSGYDSTPPADPNFLARLRELAEAVVPIKRNHACHTVWCCGNELTWTGEEDPAMQTAHEVCNRLDPDKIYIPTSPLQTEKPGEAAEIDIHGSWKYLGATEHYTMYNRQRPAFHSEFGSEGAANFENVERFIKEAKIWPATPRNPIYRHRGKWWVMEDRMREVFGEIEDPALFFRLSQFLQWEGLRYIVESGRRRKWACGGTLPWQFNEPWPNLSCTNAVDYYTDPKMAYYAVAKAYSPVHVSARYDSLSAPPGARFAAAIFANCSGQAIPGCTLEWTARDLGTSILAAGQETVGLPQNGALRIGLAEFDVPDSFSGIFCLFLRLMDPAGNLLSKNTYFFSSAPEPVFAEMKSPPQTEIKVLGSNQKPMGEHSMISMEVVNTGGAVAMFVKAVPRENKSEVFFRNNHLLLPPGERGIIDALLTKPVSGFAIAGWNTNEETVP